MEASVLVISLILAIIYPNGKIEFEKRPVEVPICQTIDGVRVEDSKCGLGACLRIGRERAAVIWGRYPGLKFINHCIADDGSAAIEGADGAAGHPALGFQKK